MTEEKKSKVSFVISLAGGSLLISKQKRKLPTVVIHQGDDKVSSKNDDGDGSTWATGAQPDSPDQGASSKKRRRKEKEAEEPKRDRKPKSKKSDVDENQPHPFSSKSSGRKSDVPVEDLVQQQLIREAQTGQRGERSTETEAHLDTSKPSAVFKPKKGRDWTLSIALPGSFIAK